MACLPVLLTVVSGGDGSLIPPVLKPLFHLPEIGKFIEAVWQDGFFRGVTATSLFFLVLWLIVLSVALIVRRDHRS